MPAQSAVQDQAQAEGFYDRIVRLDQARIVPASGQGGESWTLFETETIIAGTVVGVSVSRATRNSPGIGPLLHEILFHRAKRWERGRSLHRQLVEALDDNPAQFDQMIGRVARELETNPRREIFLQFLSDDRQVRDEEVADLVEYLYSSIVNNFKGGAGRIALAAGALPL